MVDVKIKIEGYINGLPGWQAQNLRQFRALITETVADVEEDWKWSVPVFLCNKKLVAAMSSFKEHTKFNFFNGAKLNDVHGLFNSGLESKDNRSINLAEGEAVNQKQLGELIEAAFQYARES